MCNAGVDVMKIVIEKRIEGRALVENGVSRAIDGCFLYGSSVSARNEVTHRVSVYYRALIVSFHRTVN